MAVEEARFTDNLFPKRHGCFNERGGEVMESLEDRTEEERDEKRKEGSRWEGQREEDGKSFRGFKNLSLLLSVRPKKILLLLLLFCYIRNVNIRCLFNKQTNFDQS